MGCPICNHDGATTSTDSLTRNYAVSCPRCWNYVITMECIDSIKQTYSDNRHLISGWLRNHPTTHPHTLSSSELDDIIKTSNKSPMEKANILLSYIVNLTSYFGEGIPFNRKDDYSICYSKNGDELFRLLEFLEEEKLIKKVSTVIGGGGEASFFATTSGYHKYESSMSETENSKQCFVAMWFHQEMDDVRDSALLPAIREAGYIPMIISNKEHNDKICEQILLEIKKSKFLVADVTGNRGGVYFEAGFAKALNKEVIWCCRQNGFKTDVHFDTRQYNHIVWETPEELKEKLFHRILGTVGRGKA